MDSLVYTFGGFRIDDQSRLLLHDGLRVPVPPKAADLLIVLLEGNGELIGREELIKALWPDTFVEDNNLAKHVFLLRKTLGLNNRGVAYIETVPKRGYRFVGDVDRLPPQAERTYQYQDRTREEIVIEERSGAALSMRWAAALTLLLAVGLSAAFAFRVRGKPTHNWRSVLVQPFTAAGEANPAFSAAFAREVAARLRTISDL